MQSLTAYFCDIQNNQGQGQVCQARGPFLLHAPGVPIHHGNEQALS